MAQIRGSYRFKTPLSTRVFGNRATIFSIAFYTAAGLFLCSIIAVFLFMSGFLDEEDKRVFPEESHISFTQELKELWAAPPVHSLHPCVKPTSRYKVSKGLGRYLTVRTNGGLNQMRMGISDMVAVAHIMNATLVIPQLDKRSFWKDSSKFGDIFDEDHFISTLEGDIRIIKDLPEKLAFTPRARKHFTSWSGVGYYEEMSRLFENVQVINVAKSDSRLANNNLPLDIQRLRCRSLYHALRFVPAIEELGKKLVERLRLRGKYISLHLRYEKDMLSFTGCTHGLTESEAEELQTMRDKTNHWKIKNINSTEQRAAGFCPLTPKEVGIFLEALGYPSSTLVYIAAGEIYGGDTHLAELRNRFSNVVFKETLANKEELKEFVNHASQAAALDYIISLASDVFISTYSGNMARAIEGHRRFMGHLKTINPDRKGLVEIFDKMDSGSVPEVGPAISLAITRMHRKRQGGQRRRRAAPYRTRGRARFKAEDSFYQNPYPECICTSS